jgi:hypothetical protein
VPGIGATASAGLEDARPLVMGQVVLSIVWLIGAALLMESLARLHGANAGFHC